MAGLLAFRSRIRAIADGELVSAAIADRPLGDISANLNYLFDLLSQIEGGEGAVYHQAPLDPAVLPGQAVFWDAANARFGRALAGVQADPQSGALVALASAACLGVCMSKETASSGPVLLAGFGLVDLTQALVGPVLPGVYYLSAQTPGFLTQQRPSVTCLVLVADGQGGVFVQPVLRDFLADHVHYKFALAAQPAGTVLLPDVTQMGWLPASHSSFNGLAPVGATYGYNLAAHPALARVWPPVPLSSVVIAVDRGTNHLGATLVPMGLNGLVAVDQHGIWWMSPCTNDKPWPEGWTVPVPPLPNPGGGGISCPRAEQMMITLYSTAMLFATQKTVVTSLRPAAGSPLSFVDCNGAAATTGDLIADIALNFVDDVNLFDGSIVVKDFVGTQFRRGYAVEGVIQGQGCQITSTHTGTQTIAGTPTSIHQGLVTLDVTPNQGEIVIEPEIVRLADAAQRFHLDYPYLGFPSGRTAALRMIFRVPTSLPSNPQLKIRAAILGRAAGNLPALPMTYRKLARSVAPIVTTLPQPNTETTLVFTVAGTAVLADQYTEITSAALTIAAGDVVYVYLNRAQADAYAGEVGVLWIEGVITGTG